MFGRNQVSDKDLLKTINQKITRTGTSSRITATVRQGTVTLTGNIPYEAQRNPIIKAVGRVPGVRSVVDQLKFVTKKIQHAMPPRVESQAPPVAANDVAVDAAVAENPTSPADQ